MDIAEFLLARIAEDESAARAAGEEPWQVIASDVHLTGENANAAVAVGPWGSPIGPAAIHIVRHQPLNVLAECEAKRRIVDNTRLARRAMGEAPLEQLLSAQDGPAAAYWRGLDYTLRLLALPYADHADYDPEWKP